MAHPHSVVNKNQLVSAIDHYIKEGRRLIPLRKTGDTKAAAVKDWTTLQLNRARIETFASRGHNLGWALGRTHLVIDIDPRNGGDTSLLTLCDDHNFNPADYECVQTGGGGLHIYMALPLDAPPIRTKLEEYPGIDFLSFGRQVVIAGSTHPNGNSYTLTLPKNAKRIDCPHTLYEKLKRIQPKSKKSAPHQVKNLTPHKSIKVLLENLKPENFKNHEDWLQLMQATAHASGGGPEALEAFIEWSTGDPEYANQEASIRKRWDSTLKAPPENPRSVGTLVEIARKHGVAKSVVGALISPALPDDFTTIYSDDEHGRVPKSSLLERIDKISPSTEQSEIKNLIDEMIAHGEAWALSQSRNLAHSLGLTKKAVDAAVAKRITARKRAARRRADTLKKNFPLKLAETFIARYYSNGDHLLRTSGQFWRYASGYWSPIESETVRSQITYYLIEVLQGIAEGGHTFDVAAMAPKVESVIASLVEESDAFASPNARPLPIVNTLSCQVELTSRGELKERPHNSADRLLHRHAVAYNKDAVNELFLQTLHEIFANAEDTEHVVRHVTEVLGYAIQPSKPIPMFALFYGGGANGKTLLLEVLQAVLGSCGFVAKPLSSMDVTKHAHAFADLPGKFVVYDEEIAQGERLPDGPIKALSGNAALTANPKHKPTYVFINTATPILSANHLPKLHDFSAGLQRRAQVIPFSRHFAPHERDPRRLERILDAGASGVLSLLLKAAARVLQRGGFDSPVECKRALSKWISASSAAMSWISDNLETDDLGVFDIEIAQAYDRFSAWYQLRASNGRPAPSRYAFEAALMDSGYHVSGGSIESAVFRL